MMILCISTLGLITTWYLSKILLPNHKKDFKNKCKKLEQIRNGNDKDMEKFKKDLTKKSDEIIHEKTQEYYLHKKNEVFLQLQQMRKKFLLTERSVDDPESAQRVFNEIEKRTMSGYGEKSQFFIPYLKN